MGTREQLPAGRGVVGPLGSDPSVSFAATLGRFPPELREPCRQLISGQLLRTGAGVSIFANTPASRRRTLVLVTHVDVPYEAQIHLVARPENDDPRDPLPVPDKWRTTSVVSHDDVWEVFNCEVAGVELAHRSD